MSSPAKDTRSANTRKAAAPRQLRDREPLTIAPVLVTQINCEAVIGVDARRYLEQVVPLCTGHVAAIGKLRAVPIVVVLEALRKLATSCAGDTPTELALVDDEPQDVESVLRLVGMRRIA